MPTQNNHDEFDQIDGSRARVGVHRAPEKNRTFGPIVIAVLAAVILTCFGILALTLGTMSNQDGVADASSPHGSPPESAVADESETVAPVVDTTVHVTILNGTTEVGLAAAATEQLARGGWTQQISAANADSTSISASTVYYADASLEAAARGLAESLGVLTIQLSDEYVVDAESSSRLGELTAVLGTDFVPKS